MSEDPVDSKVLRIVKTDCCQFYLKFSLHFEGGIKLIWGAATSSSGFKNIMNMVTIVINNQPMNKTVLLICSISLQPTWHAGSSSAQVSVITSSRL